MWTLRYVATVLMYLVAQNPCLANFVEDPGAVRVELKAEKFGYFFPQRQWPAEGNGQTIIHVCWEDGATKKYPNETGWVKFAVAASWQKHSRIDFRGWGDCTDDNAGIRIAVVQSGARVNTIGVGLDKMKRGMELDFGFLLWSTACKSPESQRELCIRSIAVHEFGHAIGFAHEQDRADTPGECGATQGTGTPADGLVMLTPYDPKSVMNYCNPVYNNDGELSPGDIDSVQQRYGVPPGTPGPRVGVGSP